METEKLENYDKLPAEHDLVLKYKPKAVGLGGEQVVYSLEDHPNVVIKVSKHKVKDSVIKMGEDGLIETDPSLEEWAKETYAEEIRIKNEEIKKLRDFFGKEHTLKERQYLMRVPVSEELLSEVFTNDYIGRVLPESVKDTSEVWTSVSVQEKCDEINDPDRLALSYGGFIEGKNVDPEEYEKVTRFAIGSSDVDFNYQEFLALQDQSKKKSFSKMVELARNDEKLKIQLESFIRNAIDFTKETGQILALAGDDNVIFYQEGEEWNYLLLDALPIQAYPIVFKKTVDVCIKIEQGFALTKEDKENLKRGINYVRIINGIAASLDMSDRLELPNGFSTEGLLELING